MNKDAIEAAAKAGYETLARELTGNNGPAQQAHTFTSWEDVKNPYVKDTWRKAAAAVISAYESAYRTANESTTSSMTGGPIDLAKHVNLK